MKSKDIVRSETDFSVYIGEVLNQKILSDFFTPNGTGHGLYESCNEYIAYFYAISERKDKCEQLRINDKRKEIWYNKDIDFKLYIWVDQELKIRGLKVYKDQILYAGHGRPVTKQLNVGLEEFSIIKRLFDMNRSMSAIK